MNYKIIKMSFYFLKHLVKIGRYYRYFAILVKCIGARGENEKNVVTFKGIINLKWLLKVTPFKGKHLSMILGLFFCHTDKPPQPQPHSLIIYLLKNYKMCSEKLNIEKIK